MIFAIYLSCFKVSIQYFISFYRQSLCHATGKCKNGRKKAMLVLGCQLLSFGWYKLAVREALGRTSELVELGLLPIFPLQQEQPHLRFHFNIVRP